MAIPAELSRAIWHFSRDLRFWDLLAFPAVFIFLRRNLQGGSPQEYEDHWEEDRPKGVAAAEGGSGQAACRARADSAATFPCSTGLLPVPSSDANASGNQTGWKPVLHLAAARAAVSRFLGTIAPAATFS